MAALSELKIRLTGDATQLVSAFAQSKRSLSGLEQDFKAATKAVADAAQRLKANPQDKTLAREFDNLKRSAQNAKAEFIGGRDATDSYRRALAAQGVNVRSLAADYAKLRSAQASNAPINANTTAATISIARPSATPLAAPVAADVSRSIDNLNQSVRGGIATVGHYSAAFFALQATLFRLPGAAARASDEYLKFNAQLKISTDQSGNFAQAQADVLAIANKSQSGLAEIGTLYARINSATQQLGISQQQVSNITETVALSLRVSGATAEESSSAILQLSQAFGSGVLRGEEFNAVNEASPRLMQALADSIGIPKGELRALAEQGLLTSDILASALPESLGKLQQEAASIPKTIGGAFTNLQNQFTLLIGRVNEGSGVFSGFAAAINLIADNASAVMAVATGAVTVGIAKWIASITAQRAVQRAAHIATLAEIAERTAADSVANAAALSGLAALRVAENAATGAKVAGTAATVASGTAAGTAAVAVGGLRTAISLLGGPITIAIGLVVSLGTYLLTMGDNADSGAKKAIKAIDALVERRKNLDTSRYKVGQVEAIQQDIEQSQAELAKLMNQSVTEFEGLRNTRQGGAVAAKNAEIKRLEDNIAGLRTSLVKAEAAPLGEAALKLANNQLNASLLQYRGKQAQAQAEIDAIIAQAKKVGRLDSPEVQAAIAAIKAKAADQPRKTRRVSDTSAIRQAEQAASAQLALQETLAAQADRLGEAGIQRDVALNKAAFEAKQIDAEAYYARLVQLQTSLANVEITALARQRDAAAEAVAAANRKGDTAAALNARGVVAKLNTDIALAQAKLADFSREAQAGLAAAQSARLKDGFAKLQADVDAALAALRLKEDQLKNQVQLGLPEVAAEQQLNLARRDTLATTTALLVKMQALAAANPAVFGDEAAAQLARYQLNLAQLTVATDAVATRINSTVSTSFTKLFQDIATGAATAADAFRSFVLSIVGEIQAVVAKNLSQQLLGAILPNGGAGATGGLGGLISSVLGGGPAVKKDGSTPAAALFVQDVGAGNVGSLLGNQASVAGATPGIDNASTGGSIFDGIAKKFTSIFSSVKAGFTDFFGGLGSGFESLFSGLSGIISGLFGGGGGGTDLSGLIKTGLSLFGFASGGYTGDGGTYQPKGVVHGGEYVFSKASVQRLGVSALDNLHRLAKGGFTSSLPRFGYAEGGLVNLPAPARQAAASNQMALNIVNSIDPGITHDHINTPAGERTVVNVIARNSGTIRQSLGI